MKPDKLIICFCIIFCFVLNTFGQTDNGKILFGGNTGFDLSSSKTKYKSDLGNEDSGKTTSFIFAPVAGYFIIDGLALGVSIPIIITNEKYDSDDFKLITKDWLFEPFIKYYFGTDNIKPYALGSLGVGGSKTKMEFISGITTTTSYSLFSLQVGAGIGIFFNDNVSLDIGVGYRSQSRKRNENNNNNLKSVTSGVGLNAGFIIIL